MQKLEVGAAPWRQSDSCLFAYLLCPRPRLISLSDPAHISLHTKSHKSSEIFFLSVPTPIPLYTLIRSFVSMPSCARMHDIAFMWMYFLGLHLTWPLVLYRQNPGTVQMRSHTFHTICEACPKPEIKIQCLAQYTHTVNTNTGLHACKMRWLISLIYAAGCMHVYKALSS